MNINIHVFYLLASLFVGIFLVYIYAPKPKYIVKFSSNIKNSINNDICYTYTEEECPK